MDTLYYDMIFKRKSFHIFTGSKRLSVDELQEIQKHVLTLVPLEKNIRTAFRLVPRSQTTCRRGEYCVLIYSEPKEHHLQNIGYMAEQLDLWLASKNIGACWYGMGKTDQVKFDGLGFVIMLAIEKVEETKFRKDYTKAKRKKPEEIWDGNPLGNVAPVARYAPSACNTQPWMVERNGNELKLFRVSGKRGMMPKNKVSFYNRIDMGIFMLFLELCLEQEPYCYTRTLYPDLKDANGRYLTASYEISAST